MGCPLGTGWVMADFSSAARFFGFGRAATPTEPDPADMGTAFGLEMRLDAEALSPGDADPGNPDDPEAWLRRLGASGSR